MSLMIAAEGQLVCVLSTTAHRELQSDMQTMFEDEVYNIEAFTLQDSIMTVM